VQTGGETEGTLCNKVLLADDHAVFREGLRLLMEARGFAAQVVEAATAEEAGQMVDASQDLDLAVLDLFMPGMEGLTFVKDLRLRYPALPIVLLTASEKRHDLRSAMEAGATGYIPKSFAIADILSALGDILDGQAFFPDEAMEGDDDVPDALRDVSLSPRQKEVLTLISRGHSNKEIARILDTALPTIKNHVANIFEKLGTSNRVAAVRLGRKMGLIPDE
jgi:DNA-binding NarL/FixJ family response regulator